MKIKIIIYDDSRNIEPKIITKNFKNKTVIATFGSAINYLLTYLNSIFK